MNHCPGCRTRPEILSGCINVNGVITAEVTKEYEESTVSKILDLVENASSRNQVQSSLSLNLPDTILLLLLFLQFYWLFYLRF